MKREREDDDLYDDETPLVSKPGRKSNVAPVCPYVGTVNRERLDFDFEKVCSVSLAANNVYACLVCGKFYQGRSRNTYAYVHSLEQDHHVFLNLTTKRIFCLPEDYEIKDTSLQDIKDVYDPQFSAQYIRNLDREVLFAKTIDGVSYTVGVVGLNNVKNNDHINVLLQMLGHIPTFRDYLIDQANMKHFEKIVLVSRISVLMRRMWSPKLFRNHLSPHEIQQEISNRSKNKFPIGVRTNLVQFVSWFLNTCHEDLMDEKKRSIISECFRGKVRIHAEKEERVRANTKTSRPDLSEDAMAVDAKVDSEEEEIHWETRVTKSVRDTPFWVLQLNPPPQPIFKDAKQTNIIPQEPIFTLLSKFDGVTKDYDPISKEYKTFRITKLPKEKNKTIITFPMKQLDMAPYCELKQSPPKRNTNDSAKADEKQPSTKYDLIANVKHNNGVTATEGFFNVHIWHKASDKWYDIQDLIIEEVQTPVINLSEAYLQIYERQDD